MKRTLALLLALIMTMALIPAALAADEPIMIFQSCASTIPEDDQIEALMEKDLGFETDWVVVTTEYDTQLNVRLVGGNIPDIFQVPFNKIADYAKQDLLLDVEPYLDQMPSLKASYSDEDLNRGRYNGVLYTIPKRPYIPYAAFSLRADWLKNLGLEKPTTLDELYNVMYQFTYGDPDGNGKQDTFAVTGTGLGALQNIFAAYGTAHPGKFLIEDNKVIYSSVDPRAKEAIAFIQKCVNEGLIDPELVSNNTTTARDKCISGQAGMFCGISFWDIMKVTFMEQAHTVNPNAEWELFMGVKGTSENVYDCLFDTASTGGYYAINPDLAEDPERLSKVLALFDYLCDIDGGQNMVMFGVEGVHHNVVDGVVVPTELMESLTHTYIFQLTGRDDLPYLKVKFDYLSDEIDQCTTMRLLNCYNAAVTAPSNINVADLERYAQEETIKFIYGERSLDEWDAYVETLNTTYKLAEYIDKATEDLTVKGYLN